MAHSSYCKKWVPIRRHQLIEILGGKCQDCGTTEDLQFDHKAPRTWVARKKNRLQRIALYERDAALGIIELRCGKCNRKKGKPPDHVVSEEPLPD